MEYFEAMKSKTMTISKPQSQSEPDTQVNQRPTSDTSDKKHAEVKSFSRVQELSKLFGSQNDKKPPPPPSVNPPNELVPLTKYGRRPSENSTGERDISCERVSEGNL